MKKLLNFMFHRVVLVGAAIAVQVAALIIMISKFGPYLPQFYAITTFISAVVVLAIANGTSKSGYKIAWIIPIILFPIFGGLFYLMFGGSRTGKRMRKKMDGVRIKTAEALASTGSLVSEIAAHDEHAGNQSRYIYNYAYYPPYEDTYSEYLPIGEIKFQRLVEELRKAEHYIFLEYFIIDEGVMWNTILDILVEKVQEGVDVRLIYDDVGCIMTLPYRYDRKLEAMGIKCCRFNPFIPVLSARLNNRDHRKIAVIDGHTGFTGGINLADEYINLFEKHGHWKDSAILIKGEAVWSLTVMFLTMWDYLRGTNEDYEQFRPKKSSEHIQPCGGYVQPFSDNPLDDEAVGETVYLNLINKAKRYVYINSPYLILDSEMMTALCSAAKAGVDVRIVTPHIADKNFVHAVTRSYYDVLLRSGVRIYEYTPGFMHSKTFVVDDEYGVVGTINLDYRSLYLHFECGVWLYKTESAAQIKEDFLETLKVCTEMSLTQYENIPLYKRITWSILRLFAPLM